MSLLFIKRFLRTDIFIKLFKRFFFFQILNTTFCSSFSLSVFMWKVPFLSLHHFHMLFLLWFEVYWKNVCVYGICVPRMAWNKNHFTIPYQFFSLELNKFLQIIFYVLFSLFNVTRIKYICPWYWNGFVFGGILKMKWE